MRKTVMIAAACAALLLTGCDELSSIPQDPLIRPKAATQPYAPPVKILNRATMEETLRYAANIHDTMRRYRDVLLKTPPGTDAFSSRSSVLVSEDAQWRHLLYIRQEWMSQGDFDNEHPSRKIRAAIYNLIEESKHLDNVFLHGIPLDPTFAQATDKTFEEAIASLRQYKDPPEPR